MRIKLATLLAVTTLPAFVSAQDATVRVIGRVVTLESGEAIAGATVRLGNMPYTTDARGRFLIALPAPLAAELTVEMIGYTTRTDSIKLSAGTNDLTVRLSRNPVKLPPLSVSVRSQWLEENGFYERRDEGGKSGRYIDRVEIEKRNPTMMTDLFHGVPGVKVHDLGMSMRVIQYNRTEGSGLIRPAGNDARTRRLSSLPGCQPFVYIDGRPHADGSGGGRPIVYDFNLLSPDVIEAIEVYVGAGTPIEYRNTTGCGVLLIWTRRGR